ncbi:peptide chain release factor N(5)-glutamine methyltransferase [Sphingomicrobium arenosum]|uniref:peptide chain release factor N(5)-glutamine methyltransferase n=1 Tax=Sphingomicrobium arenosum TaxID=2233861 RepID=UPI002240EA2C|nr:peptide chain release factor N(5)-glutamine methyltransferase [Sphingomicrobium arenosum]
MRSGLTLGEAAARLERVSDTPRLDAELLLAHSLGVERDRLLLDGVRDGGADFAALVERRAGGEPLAYLTGSRHFWTVEIKVGPGVLIPRPDSETLLDAAAAHFRGTAGPRRVLDLGTGPGSLLLAALDEWPRASGVGVDASEVALGYARANAEALGMADRAAFAIGDWGAGLVERFDLILCNPPYIAEGDAEVARDVAAHEPHEALYAGESGLDDYRRIVPQLAGLLGEAGLAVLEIGHSQAESVAKLLEAAGFSPVLHRDLAGRARALSITG